MIISFDMDDTLVSVDNRFQIENRSLLQQALGAEKLRQGTQDLFRALTNRGHDIYIYTTSHRSKWKLRLSFAAYGLYPSRYITGEENRATISSHGLSISKHPSLFGIDLHVDDLPGVQIEADHHGFQVVIISLDDVDWVDKVLKEVDKLI